MGEKFSRERRIDSFEKVEAELEIESGGEAMG